MKIDLVTVVFGEKYIDLYLKYCIPSLMASGNLPEISLQNKITYYIYTEEKDINIIKNNENLIKLNKLNINIIFKKLDANYLDFDKSGHVLIWKKIELESKKNSEILIFIIPDNIYSINCISNWVNIIQRGYTHITAPSPYTLAPSLIEEIEEKNLFHNGVLALTQNQLIQLYFNHIHPLSAAMLKGQPLSITHPEHRISKIKSSISIRVLTSNPLCISFKNSNPKYYVDKIKSLSLEKARKYEKYQLFAPRNLKSKFIYGNFLNNFHNELSNFEIRYSHIFDFDNENKLISYKLVNKYDKFYRKTVIIKEIYKIAKFLKNENCNIGASILLELAENNPKALKRVIDDSTSIICPIDINLPKNYKNKLFKLLQDKNYNKILDEINFCFIKSEEKFHESSARTNISIIKRIKFEYKSIFIVNNVFNYQDNNLNYLNVINKSNKVSNNFFLKNQFNLIIKIFIKKIFSYLNLFFNKVFDIFFKLFIIFLKLYLMIKNYLPKYYLFNWIEPKVNKIEHYLLVNGKDLLNLKLKNLIKLKLKNSRNKIVYKFQQINIKFLLFSKLLKIIKICFFLKKYFISILIRKINIFNDLLRNKGVIFYTDLINDLFSKIILGNFILNKTIALSSNSSYNYYEKKAYDLKLLRSFFSSNLNLFIKDIDLNINIANLLLVDNSFEKKFLDYTLKLVSLYEKKHLKCKQKFCNLVLIAARIFFRRGDYISSKYCYEYIINSKHASIFNNQDRIIFKKLDLNFPNNFDDILNYYAII